MKKAKKPTAAENHVKVGEMDGKMRENDGHICGNIWEYLGDGNGMKWINICKYDIRYIFVVSRNFLKGNVRIISWEIS